MTLDECRREVREWVSIKLTKGRCSGLLVEQLARGMQDRNLDIFAVYDEIGGLECAPGTRPRSTKPASPFGGPVLGGLWHKHYSTAAFTVQNLVNHWTPARLEALRVSVEVDTEVPTDRKVDALTYRMVMDGYRERHAGGRVTGEWIVFVKAETGNSYLTLAKHDEGDEIIRARVDQAASEFPDLTL